MMKFFDKVKALIIILRLIFLSRSQLVSSVQRNQSDDADKNFKKTFQDLEEKAMPKDTTQTTKSYSITETEDDITGTFYLFENNKVIYTVHYFKDEDIENEVKNWNMALGIIYEYGEKYILNNNPIKIKLNYEEEN